MTKLQCTIFVIVKFLNQPELRLTVNNSEITNTIDTIPLFILLLKL